MLLKISLKREVNLDNKDTLGKFERRLLKEIMNIMIPSNQEILAAGDKGLLNELEFLFFDSPVHKESIIRILDCIKLNVYSRSQGSFFSMPENKKIEILKWVEKNMFDEFSNLKEAIFSTYYRDDEVIKKINWDTDFLEKNNFLKLEWDPSILNKIKKMKPFWKKI